MTKKTGTPRGGRNTPRRPKMTPAQKRDQLIDKLLSVDELGHVAGGGEGPCGHKCGCEPV